MPVHPFSLVNNIHTRSSLISPGQEWGKTRHGAVRAADCSIPHLRHRSGGPGVDAGDGADGSDAVGPLSHGLVRVSRLAGLRVRQTVTDRVQRSPCC